MTDTQTNKKVLIIEDEAPLRGVLSDKLTEAGFNVLVAGNGKEGLEVALREKPALILLDIIMPIMDGMPMLKQLRETADGKDVKVIFLTNLSDIKSLADAMEQGSYVYLVKADWTIEAIIEKVKDLLRF
ncbi:MAG: response regulator [bacterium]